MIENNYFLHKNKQNMHKNKYMWTKNKIGDIIISWVYALKKTHIFKENQRKGTKQVL